LSTVFITGASRGIGRATAKAFANSGWDLLLLARSEGDLARLVEEIDNKKVKVFYKSIDLSNPKNISKTLPIFTSKQLFAQLILSGGLFTVLAPLMISKIGLDYWTEICALITFASLCIALILNKVEMKKFQ